MRTRGFLPFWLDQQEATPCPNAEIVLSALLGIFNLANPQLRHPATMQCQVSTSDVNPPSDTT